jgi:hypothetical protein
MKTSELEGAALDWAVAKCEEKDYEYLAAFKACRQKRNYHIDWAQGGPIIEREKISISYQTNAPLWVAMNGTGRIKPNMGGPTPLIAAMRCYVASKLGDEVDIPKELL